MWGQRCVQCLEKIVGEGAAVIAARSRDDREVTAWHLREEEKQLTYAV